MVGRAGRTRDVGPSLVRAERAIDAGRCPGRDSAHAAIRPPPPPPRSRSLHPRRRAPGHRAVRVDRPAPPPRPSSRPATTASTRTPRCARTSPPSPRPIPTSSRRFSIGKSYQGRELWAAKVSDNVGHRRGRARGPVRRPQPRRRAHGPRDDAPHPPLARRRLRHRRPDHRPREHARGLDRVRRQPRRRRVRHRRRPLPLLAQEPPAERERHRSAPTSTATTAIAGAAAAGPAATRRRSPTRARRRSPRRRPGRCATSSRAGSSTGGSRSGPRSRSTSPGRLVMWPYGYTTTDVPSDMTGQDHSALAAIGRTMAREQRLPARAGERPVHLAAARPATGCTGTYRVFSYTFEMSVVDYPKDTMIGPETGAEQERRAVPDRAGLVPAGRARRRGPRRALRRVRRRPRGRPRLDGEPRRHRHGARVGPLGARQPGGDLVRRRDAPARRDAVRAAGARDGRPGRLLGGRVRPRRP